MIYDYLLKALIIGAAMAIGSATTIYFRMKPDNFVEQAAEMVIEDQTGQVFDLSPDEVIPSTR